MSLPKTEPKTNKNNYPAYMNTSVPASTVLQIQHTQNFSVFQDNITLSSLTKCRRKNRKTVKISITDPTQALQVTFTMHLTASRNSTPFT